MKIISLNTWGGKVNTALLNFLKEQQDIDVFCFQEVYHNAHGKSPNTDPEVNFDMYSDMEKSLPGHKGFFGPSVQDYYGQAIFVKNSFNIDNEGSVLVHRGTGGGGIGNHDRTMQWIEFDYEDKPYTLMNVHGLWNGMGKTDTPDRIAQSQVIRKFLDNTNRMKILLGDFNLLPNTDSLKVVEEGMVNLIKKYNIQSTRTSFYTKPEKFADYALVSPEVVVKDFKVLPNEVSDHSPMYIEI